MWLYGLLVLFVLLTIYFYLQYNSISAKLNELTDKENDLISKMNIVNDQATKLASTQKSLQDANATLTSSLSMQTTKTDLANKQVIELQSDNDKLQQKYDNLVADRTDLQIQYNTDIAKSQADILAITNSKNKALDDYNNKVNELAASTANYESKVRELSASKADYVSKVNELANLQSKYDSKVNELAASKAAYDGKVRELADSNANYNSKVNELTASKTAYDGKVNELATSKAAYDGKVNELAASKAAYDGKVRELAASTANYNSKVNELAASKTAYDGKVNELAVSKAAYDGKVNELAASKTAYDGKVRELANLQSKYDSDINNLNNTITENNTLILSLNGNISDYYNRINSLTEQLKNSALDLQKANANILALQNKTIQQVIADCGTNGTCIDNVVAGVLVSMKGRTVKNVLNSMLAAHAAKVAISGAGLLTNNEMNVLVSVLNNSYNTQDIRYKSLVTALTKSITDTINSIPDADFDSRIKIALKCNTTTGTTTAQDIIAVLNNYNLFLSAFATPGNVYIDNDVKNNEVLVGSTGIINSERSIEANNIINAVSTATFNGINLVNILSTNITNTLASICNKTNTKADMIATLTTAIDNSYNEWEYRKILHATQVYNTINYYKANGQAAVIAGNYGRFPAPITTKQTAGTGYCISTTKDASNYKYYNKSTAPRYKTQSDANIACSNNSFCDGVLYDEQLDEYVPLSFNVSYIDYSTYGPIKGYSKKEYTSRYPNCAV